MVKFFFLVSLFSSFVLADTCLENRGALDLGSGTTKAYVAQVDICKKQIVKVLFEDRIALPLNEALEKSENKEIPQEVLKEGLPRIQSLLGQIRSHDVKQVSAVATSVFRVAKNGKEAAAQIAQVLKIPVEVISQEQEAELGYWSALAQKNVQDTNSIIVWDIGGGSMQMYAREQGRVHVFRGNLASVTFKNSIMQTLQFKDPRKHSSPNPIGQQREAALQLAKNHAYLNVPSYFKDKAAQARWIGVGGVISLSVQKQTNSEAKEFTREQLEETLKQRVLLRDDQIDSEYRVSDISNIALVLGYMQALKINKVETVKAALGQGLIFKNLK